MSRLALYLLDPPRIERDGEPVTVDRRKALALVAYLAVTGRNHSRDALATLFWPEHDQSRANASLRSALASLKKALGAGWLDADRETVGLNPDAEVWFDVGAFQDRLAECRTHGHPEDQVCPDCLSPLAEAAALYRDDFLAGFTLRDSPGFDEWQFFQTDGLREDLGSALRRLAQGHSEQGEYERAIPYARRWVALDPLHEPAHRRLMRLYAWAGQRAAALRQYGECERVLQEELGLPLEEETAQLYQAIQERRELPTPVDRAVVPVTAEPPAPRHNLPVQLTPFVGREGVLAEIGDRLQDPDCRLLTLVGPGGSGKTRLALEAAAAQLARYPHGVFFVRLAALDSAEAIVPAVARALGFSFYTEGGAQQRLSPRQQLLDYLRQKSMLLIMDNFEHLLDGVELVTDVLKTAPKVKILATSRARMKVQGEHLFPVAGMDFPTWVTARDARGTPEDAAQYSAVRLFLQSGRRVRPGFEMPADNLRDVVRICRVVAGMPLGILLAAGWVRMLTLAEIATEIGHSLDFLETDQHDLPERQRGMRAVFDHSWNLLTARERAVMQALSVFRGGFTREAAKRVTGATLHELRALVDKSLLQRDPGGRYEIHELLRQYAAEQLGGARAEEETARDRHSAYYAGFLQGRQADLMGRNQRRALAEIEAAIENVRAGWNWAVAQGKVEEIDRALESLAEFYWIRAWFQEGEETFARAAQRLAAERSETANRQSRIALGKVLMHQGRFCDPLGLAEKGRELLQKSLAIFRDLGVRREMAYALCYLGGKPLCQEALAIFKEIGDRKGIALSLEGLAWTAIVQGEYGAARQLFQESLAIFRELGNQERIARLLQASGYVAYLLGEWEVAKGLHQESLVLYQEIGDRQGVAESLEQLGIDAYGGSKEHEETKQLLQESFAIYEEIGNVYGMAYVLSELSELANVLGEYAEAIQLAQKSVPLAKRCHDRAQVAWCLRVLGRAACGLGDLEGAKRYFHQALQTAMTERATPFVLATFEGIAMLLAAEGERERALELLSLVLHHPAIWQAMKDRAASVIAELEAEMPPDVVAAVQERGRARDLEATVAELLAELGE